MVKNSIPKERYLDIMIEGAKHFEVSPDHIQWLENHEKQPRKQLSELSKWSDWCEIPSELPVITKEELENAEDLFGFNRIVFRMMDDVKPELKKRFAGQELAVRFSRLVYDPKYGIHDSLDTMTPEHIAYSEDFFTAPDRHFKMTVECVGRYE